MAYVRESATRLLFEMPTYGLKAFFFEDFLQIVYKNGEYRIRIERKSCNYGGSYRFFYCPECEMRMRKLYCIDGRFKCRKCANLGYYSQRLQPKDRCEYACSKIVRKLVDMGGNLEKRPIYMTEWAFKKMRMKYIEYDQKSYNVWLMRFFERTGIIGDFYDPRIGTYDEYVENEDTRKLCNIFDMRIMTGYKGPTLSDFLKNV